MLVQTSHDLVMFHQLSHEAVLHHAAYLEGAQRYYQGLLHRAGVQPSSHAFTLGAPAEWSWEMGWRLHFEHLQSHNLESTPERALGVIASAGFRVQTKLATVSAVDLPLEVPALYLTHMPNTFRHTSLEQVMLTALQSIQ